MSARPRRSWRARTSASPRSSELKGKKIANQTGSSIGNIFVDQIAPTHGLKKGDFQEVRMNVNDMIAAHGGQDRGRHGQRRALQRDRRGRRHRHHRSWTSRASTRCRCSWRRRPTSSRRTRTPSSPISRPGSTSQRDFKDNPNKVADVIYSFFTSKGYKMSPRHLREGAGTRRGRPGLPDRSRALHAEARRSAAAGEEDLRDAGLEEGAAARLHGQGAAPDPDDQPSARIRQGRRATPALSHLRASPHLRKRAKRAASRSVRCSGERL